MTFEEARERVQLAIRTLERRGHGGLSLDDLKSVYSAVWGQDEGFITSTTELTGEELLAALPPTAAELPDE